MTLLLLLQVRPQQPHSPAPDRPVLAFRGRAGTEQPVKDEGAPFLPGEGTERSRTARTGAGRTALDIQPVAAAVANVTDTLEHCRLLTGEF
jgi:hypothetical protein